MTNVRRQTSIDSALQAQGDRRNLVLLLGSTLLWAVSLTAANAVLERSLLPMGVVAYAVSLIASSRRLR